MSKLLMYFSDMKSLKNVKKLELNIVSANAVLITYFNLPFLILSSNSDFCTALMNLPFILLSFLFLWRIVIVKAFCK
jgi:hypothetical protein